MSAVAALQYDLVFGTGSRSSYSSWPVAEQPHRLLDHHISASYGSDISLSPPPASRSITASPPQHGSNLSLQQREYTHQCEEARCIAKFSSRRRATDSDSPSSTPSPVFSAGNSSNASSLSFSKSSPEVMADMGASSATGGLPGIYTTSGASSHISLISETAATSASLSPPPYMGTGGSYPSSLHDHQQPSVFPASYQSQTYVPEYTTSSFPASNPPPLHAQYPRTAVNDQGLMYHLASPTSLSSSSIMHHHQPVPHHAQLPQPQLHQSQPHSVHRHGGHQVSPPVSVHAQAHNGANGHHTYEGVVSGGVCSTIGGPGAPGVRIVQNRPKPQCWEHGCNGRQFSTFSNLLRHQREKSGQAAKAVCPNCGAEFTRTTARNGHLQHDKCKPRRN